MFQATGHGLDPPLITVEKGGSVWVSAPRFPTLTLTTTATDVVTIRGSEIVGVRRGKAIITTTDIPCDGRTDPTQACALLAVFVH